jgi:hypothetical protein
MASQDDRLSQILALIHDPQFADPSAWEQIHKTN